MIPIPTGLDWSITLRGRIPKTVVCERCPVMYVYFVERRGYGVSSIFFWDTRGAQQRAVAKAQSKLFQSLLTACEPVPCPGCGHVQGHMIPRARQLRHRWMRWTALYLFPTAAILFVVAGITTGIYNKFGSTGALIAAALSWPLMAVSAVGVVALPVWRYLAARRYDPNAEDVEARKQKGRVLALTREEFEKRFPRSTAGPPPGAVTPDAPGADGRVTDRPWSIEWPENGRGSDDDTSRSD
jgi:hypothetical protein